MQTPPALEVYEDAGSLARAAARYVAAHAVAAIAERGRFAPALSGGRTPWAMLTHLADAAAGAIAWESVEVHQVDERVAPDGDPARNLTHLLDGLPEGVRVHPMPVTDPDLDAAAARYAAGLPDRFDLVHLGLGDDGHTASLVPGDAALDVTDRDVAVTDTYRGHRRMTLTYPALERARGVLWLVSGADKAEMLVRLLGRDPSIPAGRVGTAAQVVMADAAAARSVLRG